MYLKMKISFFIKALFLGIFILLNIYLLYQEFKLIEHQNIDLRSKIANSNSSQQFYSESDSSPNKKLSQYFFIYGPALISYFSVYNLIKESNNSKESFKNELQARAELEKDKNEIKAEQSISEAMKAKYVSNVDRITNEVDNYKNATVNLMDPDPENQQTLNQIEQLKVRKLKGDQLTQSEQNLICEETLYKNKVNYYEHESNKAHKVLADIKGEIQDDINQSSLFSFDFNEIFKNLNIDEQLALCNLVFNQLILSNIIGISLILYGDYLIKRFNLENKYPKLAKLIHLRNKFKEYNLKISILLIILCVVPQIAMNIFILLPKLQSIFTS